MGQRDREDWRGRGWRGREGRGEVGRGRNPGEG